jgi:hypothetical protein
VRVAISGLAASDSACTGRQRSRAANITGVLIIMQLIGKSADRKVGQQARAGSAMSCSSAP